MVSCTPNPLWSSVFSILSTPASSSPKSIASSSSNGWGSLSLLHIGMATAFDDGAIRSCPRAIGELMVQCDESMHTASPVRNHKALKHGRSSSMDTALFVPYRARSLFSKTSINDSGTTAMMIDEIPYVDQASERSHSLPLRTHNSFHYHNRLNSDSFLPYSRSKAHSTRVNAQSLFQGETNGSLHQALYDPYVTPPSSMATSTHTPQSTQINPYSQDSTTTNSSSYYQNSSFAQPIQYHLYTSLGPHREALLPYQRAAHDFFIPDALREELQRKSATTLQTLPSKYNTTLHGCASLIGTPYSNV